MIDLKENECALIFRNDGGRELHMPKPPDDGQMPRNVVLMSAIAGRLSHDPKFQTECLEWLEKQRLLMKALNH